MSELTEATLTIHDPDSVQLLVPTGGEPYIFIRFRPAADDGLAMEIEAGNGVDNENGGMATVLSATAKMLQHEASLADDE